jgi:hypothetical protein
MEITVSQLLDILEKIKIDTTLTLYAESGEAVLRIKDTQDNNGVIIRE